MFFLINFVLSPMKGKIMNISKKIENAYVRLEEYEGVVAGLRIKFATADVSTGISLQRQWKHLLVKCAEFRAFLMQQEKPIPGHI